MRNNDNFLINSDISKGKNLLVGKQRIRLLVVDDEVDVCDFVRSFFRERNFEVFVSCDGRTAVDIVKDKHPDIILLDMLMPVMNGMEALKEIRKMNNDVKIIIVTAVEDDEIVAEARNYGIIEYMTKPLILEQLEKIVMNIAGKIKV
jgi:DNA-binding response OmpR family regulator